MIIYKNNTIQINWTIYVYNIRNPEDLVIV